MEIDMMDEIMNAGPGSTIRINDDLANFNLSRQRKYQIRKRRAGLCIICGKKAYRGTLLCLNHNHKRGIRAPGKYKHHALE